MVKKRRNKLYSHKCDVGVSSDCVGESEQFKTVEHTHHKAAMDGWLLSVPSAKACCPKCAKDIWTRCYNLGLDEAWNKEKFQERKRCHHCGAKVGESPPKFCSECGKPTKISPYRVPICAVCGSLGTKTKPIANRVVELD